MKKRKTRQKKKKKKRCGGGEIHVKFHLFLFVSNLSTNLKEKSIQIIHKEDKVEKKTIY